MDEAQDRPSTKVSENKAFESSWPTGAEENKQWQAVFNSPETKNLTVIKGTQAHLDTNTTNLYASSILDQKTSIDTTAKSTSDNRTFSETQYREYSSQTKVERSLELSDLRNKATGEQPSLSDRKRLGEWLSDNFSRLDGTNDKGNDPKTQDGRVSFGEVKSVYAKGEWPDGQKLSREETRMLRQTAVNFDSYNVNDGAISKRVLSDLEAGAEFTKTDNFETISRLPNGTTTEYSRSGSWLMTKPDGTIIANSGDARDVTITMRPDGTGESKMRPHGTETIVEMQLRKSADGSWNFLDSQGKSAGSVKFDTAKKEFELTTPDSHLEFDGKTNKLSMQNKDGSGFDIKSNALGTPTLETRKIVNGKAEEYSVDLDKGTVRVLNDDVQVQPSENRVMQITRSDNSKEYSLPTGDMVYRPASGGTALDVTGRGLASSVRVEVAADGQAKVLGNNGQEIPTKEGSNGSKLASSGDITVEIKAGGTISVVTGTGKHQRAVILSGDSVSCSNGTKTPTKYNLPS